LYSYLRRNFISDVFSDKKVSVTFFESHPDVDRVRLGGGLRSLYTLVFWKITFSHLFMCSDSSLYAASREDVQHINHAQSLPDAMTESRLADICDNAASG